MSGLTSTTTQCPAATTQSRNKTGGLCYSQICDQKVWSCWLLPSSLNVAMFLACFATVLFKRRIHFAVKTPSSKNLIFLFINIAAFQVKNNTAETRKGFTTFWLKFATYVSTLRLMLLLWSWENSVTFSEWRKTRRVESSFLFKIEKA